MRLYVAGPMRGIPEFNFPAFDDAARQLRALGHEVFSPAEYDRMTGFDPADMTGQEPVDIDAMLAKDLDWICQMAEAVVVLPGWDKSSGVNAEIATAQALAKPVWTLDAVLRGDAGTGDAILDYLAVRVPTAVAAMRTFDGGATRDTEDGKLDYEGFLSPAVLGEFAYYMHKHRVQSDGTLRSADNWQKGMPRDVYMKSMFRHFMDVWFAHRGLATEASQMEALMALLFNVQGYAFEILNDRDLGDD